MIKISVLKGDDIADALPALADLRIRIFKEWPYLYDGSAEYEQNYLKKFGAAKDALIVVARDKNKIVGVSTASPLLGHADAFAEAFTGVGYDPKHVFYFGESVLLPEYRGQGIGHAFFDEREKHARSFGTYKIASFSSVIRDKHDPRAPENYFALDSFWAKRGYTRAEGVVASLGWKEGGATEEITHQMQFWIKKL
jgi:GNAT superfamily N-acetyltransferase